MKYRNDKNNTAISQLGDGCMRFSKNGNNSFLFSLDKQIIYPNKNATYGIWCNSAYGPSFGYDEILMTGNCLKEKKLKVLSSSNKDKYGYDYLGYKNPFLEKTQTYLYALEYEVLEVIFE